VTAHLDTADGRRLAYERRGSGPLVICHPGGPGLSARYFTDLGGLDDQLELVLLDPRGTGGSTRPADRDAYRIEDYVADVDEVRARLGLETIRLLGYSHGGVVALAYAAAHPARVERLAVVCGSARFDPEQVTAIEQAVQRRRDEPWFEAAAAAFELEATGSASEDELRQAMADMLPLYFYRWDERAELYGAAVQDDVPNADAMALWEREIFATFDLRPQLASITCPTLVITGADDFITGPTAAKEVAAHVADAELVVLPECGHMLWVEQPEGFRSAVSSFFRG
jgi:proline-specific peptidase